MRPTAGEVAQLSTTVYPERCVLEAAEAYKSFCSVMVTRAGDEISVSLAVGPNAHEAQRILDEFLNYALDLSVRMHVGMEGDG